MQTKQNSATAECPVCHKTFDGIVCDNCGWAVIEFPAVIPDEIAKFESRRRDAAVKSLTSAGQKPKAFLILRDPADPDDVSVVSIGPGGNRYVNSTVAAGLPDPLPDNTQIVRVTGSIRVDFEINEHEGRFFVVDSESTLLLDGASVVKQRPLVNGAKLTFKSVGNAEAVMSIPRRRR